MKDSAYGILVSRGFGGFSWISPVPFPAHFISISFSVRYRKPFSRFRQGLRYRPEVCHIRYGTCHGDITARFVLLKGSAALQKSCNSSHNVDAFEDIGHRNLPTQG